MNGKETGKSDGILQSGEEAHLSEGSLAAGINLQCVWGGRVTNGVHDNDNFFGLSSCQRSHLYGL